jgi:hypothetical protein
MLITNYALRSSWPQIAHKYCLDCKFGCSGKQQDYTVESEIVSINLCVHSNMNLYHTDVGAVVEALLYKPESRAFESCEVIYFHELI